MSVEQTPAPEVIKKTTFNEFIGELQQEAWSHVRLVKVDDQGIVEPAKRGGAFVMQPMVRVVATAFDKRANKILHWERKWDTGSGDVSIDAMTGRSTHRDVDALRTREQVTEAIEMEGYQVASGEWTPASVQMLREAQAGGVAR